MLDLLHAISHGIIALALLLFAIFVGLLAIRRKGSPHRWVVAPTALATLILGSVLFLWTGLSPRYPHPLILDILDAVWALLVVATALLYALRSQNFLGWAMETEFRQEIDRRKAAEAELKQRQQTLERVLDSLPVLFNAIDETGCFAFWNRECERLTGYSRAEILHNPRAWEILYPDPAYRERMLAEQQQHQFSFRNWEWMLTCKDGSERIISWSDQAHSDPIPGWSHWGTGVDVTEGVRAKRDLEELARTLERRVAERTAELDQEKELLRTILESMTEGVFAVRKPNQTLLWNAAARRITGVDNLDDYLKDRRMRAYREDGTFLPPEQYPVTLAIETGRPVERMEIRIAANEPTANDIDRWISISASPLRDAGGEIFGGVAVFRDVTRIRQIRELREESERMFRELVEHAPFMIWLINPDSETTYVNRLFLDYSGLTFDEYCAGGWRKLVHAEDLGKLEAGWRESFAHRRLFESEFRILRPDQSYATILAQAVPRFTHDRSFQGYMGCAIDITELRAARVELERYARELERRNVDLQQFASVASHDLQEPLRKLTVFVQLLEKRMVGTLDAESKRIVAQVVSNASRMRTLIEDLLAYARVGGTRGPKQVVPLNRVFARVRDHLEIAIHENQAIIEVPLLPDVLGHETELIQLFQNLLGNSIKFRSEAPPYIRVSACLRTDEVEIRLEDNGIGVDPADAQQLFAIFHRLHPRDRYPGNGIGLAIAYRIVEKHGGRLWVEPHPERAGTTFALTLPLAQRSTMENLSESDLPESQGQAAAPSNGVHGDQRDDRLSPTTPSDFTAQAYIQTTGIDSISQDGEQSETTSTQGGRHPVATLNVETTGSAPQGRRVVVVEDDAMDVEWITGLLDSKGIATLVFRDGGAALDYVRATLPLETVPSWLIILDLNLPRVDGLTVLRAIRAAEGLDRLPVVVLTTSRDPRELDAVRDLATSVITKPDEFTEFMRTVERVVDYWCLTAHPPKPLNRSCSDDFPLGQPIAPSPTPAS